MSDLSPLIASLREADPDRFLCVLASPAPARETLAVLYAFNAELARIAFSVTQPGLGMLRLQWWREVVEEGARGRTRRHPVAEPLARLVAARGLDPSLFDAVITARELELDEAGVPDPLALEAYAAASAGGLMRIALDALCVTDAASRTAAKHAGTAAALVGSLRNARALALRGRTMLPRALLQDAGARVADFARSPLPEPARRVASAIAEMAADHVRLMRQARPARAALPVLLPAVLAARVLGRLARFDNDLADPRVEGPRLGAQWAVFRAAFTGRI
ncbi:squalene/phytoene synthase family protein [Elioraea tepida]|uniref:Squalene/phytoene synthase family protein n=1 Tax=Elioraea tepida TaxID=2843330 RepID=A0A975U221_9PROT|nr:squalene/phytoene synthase family protein [Elioraea tepida]QXM24961.1 squalene/phytoene synthase family protein [Elioraea tepida]